MTVFWTFQAYVYDQGIKNGLVIIFYADKSDIQLNQMNYQELVKGLTRFSDFPFSQEKSPMESDTCIENYKAKILKVYLTFHACSLGDWLINS